MEHELNEGQIDKGFGGLGQALIVLGEAAIAVGPGDGTLDDPALGQKDKAFLAGFACDDLDVNVKVALDEVDKLTLIGTVGKELLEARIALGECEHEPLAAFTIGNIGAVDENAQQQSHGINQEVPLASGDPFFPR